MLQTFSETSLDVGFWTGARGAGGLVTCFAKGCEVASMEASEDTATLLVVAGTGLAPGNRTIGLLSFRRDGGFPPGRSPGDIALQTPAHRAP